MTKMKVILCLLGVLVFTACEKQESSDFRDKHIGRYSGTVTVSIPAHNYYHTRENVARIIKGYGTNELGIQNLGVESYSTATLNNDTYIYYPFDVGGSSCGSTSVATYRGRGWFKGDSLIEEGTITLITNGQVVEGKWNTKMIRK